MIFKIMLMVANASLKEQQKKDSIIKANSIKKPFNASKRCKMSLVNN